MIETLFRLLAELGPAVDMTARLAAAVVASLVLYTGVAMMAALFSRTPERFNARYRVFRDLLRMFRRGRR